MEVIHASVRGERFFWLNVWLRMWNDAFIKPEECYYKKRYILEEEKWNSHKLFTSNNPEVIDRFEMICDYAGIDPDLAKDKFKYWQAHKPEYYSMIRRLKENRIEPEEPEFSCDITLADFSELRDKLFQNIQLPSEN